MPGQRQIRALRIDHWAAAAAACARARTTLATAVHVVRKPEGQHGFAVIPRHWYVERTLAWFTAHRRLARDYERDPATSEAMIRWTPINTMISRIAAANPPHGNNAGTGLTNHDRV